MSLTLSPPIRVAALVGALLLTGLAAAVFLLGRGALGGEPAAVSTTAPAVKPSTRVATSPKSTVQRPSAARPATARAASGFPPQVDHAFRYRRVVVVSVSMPGAAVDAIVRREARSAARASRAGFVAVSATNERAVSALVAKTGLVPIPAVVVVKRPGVVMTTFSVTDAGTIAQAIAQARR